MPIISRSLSFVSYRPRRRSRVESDHGNGDVGSESTASKQNLGTLFFNLPVELQLSILVEISGRDILNIRLTSRAFYDLTAANEATIAKGLLQAYAMPSSACRCTPRISRAASIDPLTKVTFSAYYQALHQSKLIARLSDIMVDFVERKVLRIQGRERRRELWIYRLNFWKQTSRPLRHLLRWLITYRQKIVEVIERGEEAIDHGNINREIFRNFNIICLVDAFGLYRLLMFMISMGLRPPSFAESVERTLRNWNEPGASDEDIIKLLVFGGLDAVADVSSIKGYSARRSALKTILGRIDSYAGLASVSPKQRRLSLPRRSSHTGEKPQDHVSRLYDTPTQETQAPESTLPKINCTILPKVSPGTAAQMLEQLPDMDNLFRHPAESVILSRVPNLQAGNVPSTMSYITWALTRDPLRFASEIVGTELQNEVAEMQAEAEAEINGGNVMLSLPG